MKFKKDTYSLRAAEYIRGLIRSGELLPGQPVRESVIAERLNISRAPIREALLMLGQQGLIHSEPQKGKYVRAMSGDEIADNFSIAGILAGAGAAWAVAKWTDKDEDSFRQVVRRLDDQGRKGNLELQTKIDDDFHATLLSKCGNPILIELTRTSCASIAKYLYYAHWRTLFTPQEFYDRHKAIAEAVFSKNSALIESAIRRHYEETGRRMRRVVPVLPAAR